MCRAVKSVWLPDDICETVLSALQSCNINYKFYAVTRTWIAGRKDTYILPELHEGEWLLISDLFNFDNYKIPFNLSCNVILDLAHSSLDNFVKAQKNFLSNNNLRLICLSFGKGKYHRLKNGGGIGLESMNDSVSNQFLSLMPYPNYVWDTLPNFLVERAKFTETSTRLVLKSCDLSPDVIKNYRSMGFDISDGLINHRTNKRIDEYYLWKKIK